MVGVLLGTFARDGSAEEDMRRPGCKRQAEIGSICNALGISNVWVWVRMRNLQDTQFTRPHVPLVRGSCVVLVSRENAFEALPLPMCCGWSLPYTL
jgi:hypothetical protein